MVRKDEVPKSFVASHFLCPSCPQASRNTVVDLQRGDPACREVWTLLCDISRKEFQKVYDRLGVSLEEHGESFYNDMIPGAIDALAAAGLVSKDDGADIVMLENFTYPLIVRKRDGEMYRLRVEGLVFAWSAPIPTKSGTVFHECLMDSDRYCDRVGGLTGLILAVAAETAVAGVMCKREMR